MGEHMKRASSAVGIVLLSCTFALLVPIGPYHVSASGPTYVGGHITFNTTWGLENSPYVVVDNVTVDVGKNLTVEPGVTVKLNPYTALFVEGILYAVGEPISPIVFTSNKSSPTQGDWGYIKFTDTSNDSRNLVKNARIEYAVYGIWCIKSSPTIVENIISEIDNKGIYLQESNAIVMGNEISNVSNRGIDMTNSAPQISNNTIHHIPNYGIRAYLSNPIIEDNDISDTMEGIYTTKSSSTIVGNTITAAADGVYLDESHNTSISNNTIRNGQYGIYLALSNSIFVENTEIVNNDFGVYTQSSSLVIINSTVSYSGFRDFFLAGESYVNTLNTTLDEDKLLIQTESTLAVNNYLAVEVRKKDNGPILGASIQVKDDDVIVHSYQTDISGLREWMVVLDRKYIGGNIATDRTTTVYVSYGSFLFLNNPRNVDMSISHTEVFKIKNISPVLNITQPAVNESVWGTTTIGGLARDSDGQIIAVELKIGASDWQPLDISPAPTLEWNLEWDTRTVSNGTIYICARTVDSDGEWNSSSIFVRVENLGPIIRVTSHNDGDVVRGFVEIVGETTDERGSVTSVMVRINSEPWVIATIQETNWSRWTYTFDTRELANGEHVISIHAQDDQPANSTVSLTLRIDNPRSVTKVVDWLLWIIVPAVIAIVVLAVFAMRRRRRSETGAEEGEGRKEEKPSDERIDRLRKAYEDGLITKDIFELNLAKLGVGNSVATVSSTEEVSYACPKCNGEVEADATVCDHCGAHFEE